MVAHYSQDSSHHSSLTWDEIDHEAWDYIEIAQGPGSAAEKLKKISNRLRELAAAPELLAIAKRWAALDGGAWHPERYANEKKELKQDTITIIAKAEGR